MKIDSRFKIELAASTDKIFKSAMCQVMFEEGKLVATTGHILASVPVEDSGNDTKGYITPEALKAARKLGKKHGDVQIFANGSFLLSDGSTIPRPEFDGFPDTAPLLESARSRAHEYRIKLNARLLHNLADALGNEQVTLEFGSSKQAVYVKADGLDSEGMVMPIREDR